MGYVNYTQSQKQETVNAFISENLGVYKFIKKNQLKISGHTLYRWIRIYSSYNVHIVARVNLKSYFDIHTKLKAVKLVKNGENVKDVASKTGVTYAMLYRWLKTYKQEGEYGLMGKKELENPAKWIKKKQEESARRIKELEAANLKLQMEIDILKEVNKIAKKCPGLRPQELTNKFKVQIVNCLRSKYKLNSLLENIRLEKSTYMNYGKDYIEVDKYAHIRQKIIDLFNQNRQVYGYRRIWFKLRNLGLKISEKIVQLIMKQEKLIVFRKRMGKYNSYDKSKDTSYAPNLLERDFHADKPFEKLVTDITEFKLDFGKVYLSPVIDLYNGEVLSWKIDTKPKTKFVLEMLDDLIKKLPFYKYIILHSDRGCQYHSKAYVKKLESRGIVQSMSKKGCSPDNAAAEGFFGHLKNEFFYKRDFSNYTKEQFSRELNDWINWYNRNRIKMKFNGFAPTKYRISQGYFTLEEMNKKEFNLSA